MKSLGYQPQRRTVLHHCSQLMPLLGRNLGVEDREQHRQCLRQRLGLRIVADLLPSFISPMAMTTLTLDRGNLAA